MIIYGVFDQKKNGDEFVGGFSEQITVAQGWAQSDYAHLSAFDKARSEVSVRGFEIPDTLFYSWLENDEDIKDMYHLCLYISDYNEYVSNAVYYEIIK